MRSAIDAWHKRWRQYLPWIDEWNHVHLDNPVPDAVRQSLITGLLDAIERTAGPAISSGVSQRHQSSGALSTEAKISLERSISGLMQSLWNHATFACQIRMPKEEADDLVAPIFWERDDPATPETAQAVARPQTEMPKLTPQVLSEQFKARRNEKLGTAEHAAQKLTCSPSTLHRWENGTVPRPKHAVKISNVLQWPEFEELARSVRPKRNVPGKRKTRSHAASKTG